MHIVGLTGGIACGKTTVASTFREEGLAVIDLDAISRQATKTGHWGYRRVVRAFGRGILTTDASGEVRLHTAEHRRTPFLLLRLSLSLSLSLSRRADVPKSVVQILRRPSTGRSSRTSCSATGPFSRSLTMRPICP